MSLFVALAFLGILLILVAGILLADDALPLPRLFASTALLALAPWAAARALLEASRSSLRVSTGALAVGRDASERRVALAAVERLDVWRIALPSPGLTIHERGREMLVIAAPDPGALLLELGDAGLASARHLVEHPAVRDAHAKCTARARWWHRPWAKVGLLSLPPGLVMFQLHQRIAYGAPLGQWVLEGAWPWLRTLGAYLLATALHLAMWAALWRVAIELVCLTGTLVAPSHVERTRRVAERCGLAACWLGPPLFLALRLAA